MSEKKDLSRSDQVRLRRESRHRKRVERARKDATRPAPPVTSRARQAVAAPKRKPCTERRAAGSRLRSPSASDAAAPISIPRPRLGMRLFSFLVVALLGAAIYFVYNLPTFRVTQAQVTGNQLISAEELNAALSITGQPVFLLKPSDLETRLRLNYPELALGKCDGLPAECGFRQCRRAQACHPLGAGRRLHLDRRGWRGIPSAGRESPS